MIICTAQDNDLPEIVAIYNQAVQERFCTADIHFVSVQDRRNWFNQHSADDYPIFVAVEDGKIAGWCTLSPYRTGREALRTTAEISYYIDSSRRDRGSVTAL